MITPAPVAGLSLALLGVLIGAASRTHAAAPAWIYASEGSTVLPWSIDGAVVLDDGATLITSLQPGTGARRSSRLMPDGSLVPLGPETATLPSFDFVQRGASVVLLPMRSAVPDPGNPPPVPTHRCLAHRLPALGMSRRALSTAVDADLPTQRQRHAALDAGLGAFVAYASVEGPNAAADRVVRLGPDCHETLLHTGSGSTFVPTPHDVGAYLVLPQNPPSLTRVGPEGQRWSRRIEVSGGSFAQTIEILGTAPSGELFVRARIGTQAPWLVALDDAGTVRWSRVFEAGAPKAFAATGELLAFALESPSDRNRHRIIALAPDGSDLWSEVVSGVEVEQVPSPRTDADLLFKVEQLRSDPLRPEVFTLFRANREGWVQLSQGENTQRVAAELSDGSLIIQEGALDSPRWFRTDARLRSRVELRAQGPGSRHVAGSLVDEYGSALLEFEPADQRLTFVGLAPSGAVKWRTELPDAADHTPTGVTQFLLGANDATACAWSVGGERGQDAFLCVDRQDGSLRHGWVHAPGERDSSVPPRLARIQPHADGRVDAVTRDCAPRGTTQACSDELVRYTFESDGSLRQRRVLAPDNAGSALRDVRSSPGGNFFGVKLQDVAEPGLIQWRLLDDSGAPRWTRAVDGVTGVIAVGDDGHVLLWQDGSLLAIDPQGGTRWTQALPASHLASIVVAVQIEGGDWIVHADPRAYPLGRHPSLRIRLRAADGSVAWQHTESVFVRDIDMPWNSTSASADRLQTLQGADVLVAAQLDGGNGPAPVLAFDTTSGRALGGFMAHASTIASDGSALDLREDPASGKIVVRGLPASALLGGESLLDASLLGAWGVEGIAGQGLFLDADRASGTVYGGFFTYALSRTHLASEQRWYTLVGEFPTSGEAPVAAELAVYESRNGRFAQPPAAASRQIGRAWLRAGDCDRAVIEFEFDTDAVDTADVILPLTRAAPRSRACAAGETDAVAARGLDPRSSGAWYSTALPGQGLAFDLRPPTDTDPGLFAGAWFTFDVEGASDDPTSQHWFTLAGALHAAADGALTVPMYRSSGGSIDFGPTSNTWQVGSATLTFSACDAATLEYTFLDDEIAHAFRNRSGSLALQRVGGCGD